MNRHAMEAREREQERSAQAKAIRAREQEDAMWAEDDAKVLKKQSKQREAEEKAQRQAEQRALKKELLLREEEELSASVPKKVARRQIQKDLSKMLTEYDKTKQAERRQESNIVNGNSDLPKGNPNRDPTVKSRGAEESSVHVGGLNEALDMLKVDPSNGQPSLPENRHIGQRARVLYRKFCEEELPKLREGNPGLRRSQYNDLLWELWQKSTMNPFVQRNEQRSKERLEQERRWMEGEDVEEDDANSDE
ncbi:hypothetical protein TRVL_02190 [Trypanosoma vivax]|nr:hypothetical protein TRVL_02190 [Trypanosoma vivax]